MPALPPRPRRSRPRRGSIERPVNGRLYRGTWLLVGLPLLLAAFSVARPQPLPQPSLPAAFDRATALSLAQELARTHPDRRPGTSGDAAAARWLEGKLGLYGFRPVRDRFEARVPGRGAVGLENVSFVARGRSPDAIVVLAHRDNTGAGPGANDNASGTAALVELARFYALGPSGRGVTPAHTVVFLSTDGATEGALGADRFARTYPGRIVAVVNLDGIAGPGRPRLAIAGSTPRSPAASLVATAAARIAEETHRGPARPLGLAQLVDLGFPYSLYEQAPFVGRGIPAVTITTLPERPPPIARDTPDRLDAGRYAQLGRAAQGLLGSLDQGLELAQGTTTYVYLGARIVRGWALELVLIAMLLPFAVAAIDLFARGRRRRIPLAPALRSYRNRLLVWLWAGAMFLLLSLLGAWPDGAKAALDPSSSAAGDWPALALLGLLALSALGWVVGRHRIVLRRPLEPEEELAGYTAALLALGGIALLVVATNPFALVFVLPSLHAWLWLPQTRGASPWARAAALAGGLVGPLLLLWSIGARYGLGFDAPWYLLELVSLHYVSPVAFAIALAWCAVAAQLFALTAGHYAPYAARDERPPRGPIRSSVRAVVLATRRRRGGHRSQERAVQSVE